MKARCALIAGVVAALSAATAYAAPPVEIRDAVYVPKTEKANPHIEVVFDAIFETAAAVNLAQDTTKYRLVDLYGGKGRTFDPVEITIQSAVVPTLPWLPAQQLNTVQLFLANNLPAAEDDRYILIISGLTIGEKAVAVTAAATPVTMSITTETPVTPNWVKAKDKDASDIYFSGSVSRSAATKFYGNADLKFRYPMFEPTVGGRVHAFAPSFDLAASENPDADPDSMSMGVVWQFFPIQKRGALLPITRWENALEHESSKDFDYRTALWRSEFLFLPKGWKVGEDGWFWVNALAGIAVGKILEVPESAFATGSLSRLLAGLSATLEVPVFFGKELSINAEYQVRRQYQDELVGKITLGKGSHPWRTIKAEVMFNDYVSFGAEYKDGEQPPKYEDVNRSLTFDLTFKAARKNKPQ